MPLPPNTRLGRYEIRTLIGAGGMGEVYLAEDTELERQVALKILLAEVASDADRVRRFVQEAKSASALNHPNILTVYEIGTFENSRFIATELIQGETLRAHNCKGRGGGRARGGAQYYLPSRLTSGGGFIRSNS